MYYNPEYELIGDISGRYARSHKSWKGTGTMVSTKPTTPVSLRATCQKSDDTLLRPRRIIADTRAVLGNDDIRV